MSFKQFNVFQEVSGVSISLVSFREFQGVLWIVKQSLRVVGSFLELKQLLRRFKELMYKILVLLTGHT